MKKYLLGTIILLIFSMSGCERGAISDGGNGISESLTETYIEESSEANETEGLQDDVAVPGTESEEIVSEESEEEISETEVLISLAGDVTLGTHHKQEYAYSFTQAYDREQNPGYFFQNVLDIFAGDDMTLVNLEGLFTERTEKNGKRNFYIKGKPEYADILPVSSIEAVSMANNHRLDYGEQATLDTVELLDERGIVYAYEDCLGIYETKGIRIGFVSVSKIPKSKEVEKLLKESIEKLRSEGVDLIFACCHCGVEATHKIEQYQKTLAHSCIDWGADLVIGHHPHVLQGIEEYKGKYIFYSLGNFCFGGNRNPPDKDTMIVQVCYHFLDGVRQGKPTVKIIPCSISSIKERNDYVPTPKDGEEGERILQKIRDISKEFALKVDEDGYIISDSEENPEENLDELPEENLDELPEENFVENPEENPEGILEEKPVENSEEIPKEIPEG